MVPFAEPYLLIVAAAAFTKKILLVVAWEIVKVVVDFFLGQ